MNHKKECLVFMVYLSQAIAPSVSILAPITSKVVNPVRPHQNFPKSHSSAMLLMMTNGRTKTENKKFDVLKLKTNLLLGVKR